MSMKLRLYKPPKTTSWEPGTKASKHTEIAWPDAPLNTLSILQPPKTTSWEPAGAKGGNTKQYPDAPLSPLSILQPSSLSLSYILRLDYRPSLITIAKNMVQLIGRITMEVAPSKMPSIIRRAKLPKILDTIMEDDKEALEPPRAPSHNGSHTKEVLDTPMYCADKLAFLVPMAKTECLKIKA